MLTFFIIVYQLSNGFGVLNDVPDELLIIIKYKKILIAAVETNMNISFLGKISIHKFLFGEISKNFISQIYILLTSKYAFIC